MTTRETLLNAAGASNRIIQGLWVGSALSTMEQLSLASFLANGHDYHLYVYEDVKHVPPGTILRDANEILPASAVFQYAGRPSYAGFANFFRYKLLLERGGWWADTDMVCLKAFDFPDEYVFSSEISKGVEVVNCGVVKAPAASEVMAFAWKVCQTKNIAELVWGETGPRLMAEAVSRFSLTKFTKPPDVFCPVAFFDWRKILEPHQEPEIKARSYAVHLWNEKWREAGLDKDDTYSRDCLYEELKRRYLVNRQDTRNAVKLTVSLRDH